MRWLPAAVAISLTCTACSRVDSELPPPYDRVPVPQARLRSPEAIARGRALYASNCALCHGERGDGRGQRAAGFSKAPANFTDPAWRQRTSERRVFYAIREGLRGTPMPSWKALSEDESWDLVAFVLSVGRATPGGRAGG
jgi:mono/diheme cytochrome c family protein